MPAPTARPIAAAVLSCALLLAGACSNPLRETVEKSIGSATLAVLGSGDVQVPPGGVVPIGDASIGATREVVFKIRNDGPVDLVLSGTPMLRVSPAGPFSVSTQPSSQTVKAGASVPFTVSFTPVAEGKKTATIEISSNDPASPLFSFTVSATGRVAAFNVFQGNNSVADGSGTYDFQSLEVNFTHVDVEFTIQNTGTGDLYLTGNPAVSVAMANGRPPDVTVLAPPSSATVPSMQSVAFTLRFAPTLQTGYQATISIPSSDPRAPTYTFTVTGTGVNPDVTLTQGATSFVSGSSSPVDLGSCAVLNTRDFTFQIGNQGPGRLFLTGSPRVRIEGSDSALFSIVSQPAAAPIAQGATAAFALRFSPTVLAGTGTKTATLVIPNNDPDSPQAPFRALVSATATEPLIGIKVGADSVPKNGSWDFGTTILGSTTTVGFAIENAGPGELILQSPYLTLTGSSHFYVSGWPSANTIQSGATATFSISYSPAAVGSENATLQVLSNDVDSSPYTITLSAATSPYHGIKVLDGDPLHTTAGMYNAAAVSGDAIYDAYYDYTNKRLKFAASPNGGAAFSLATINQARISGQANALAVNGGAIYLATYIEGTYGMVTFMKSTDGGATWPTVRLVDGASGLWVGRGGLAIGASGSSVYIAYRDDTAGNLDLKFARSTDGGSTWSVSVIDSTGDTGYNPAMVVRGSTIYIAYLKEWCPALATSTDGGLNWSLSSMDAATNTGGLRITIDENAGDLYAAYYASGTADLKFAHKPAAGSWTTSTVDSASDTGREACVKYAAGKVYIAYQDYTNKDLKLAVSGNNGGSWAISTPQSAGPFGYCVSLAVEGSTVHIFHYDSYNECLIFLRSLDGGATW